MLESVAWFTASDTGEKVIMFYYILNNLGHRLSNAEPENTGQLCNQGTHRSLYVVPVVFVCLPPLPTGTYSQPKIESKECIESQINRDGFVFIWRTASNRAGRETRTVYKDIHFKSCVYAEPNKKKGEAIFLFIHHEQSIQTHKFISQGKFFYLGSRGMHDAWIKPLDCARDWK